MLSSCHYNQRDRFSFVSNAYIIIGIIGGVVVAAHATLNPRCPSYISSLTEFREEAEEVSDGFKWFSGTLQNFHSEISTLQNFLNYCSFHCSPVPTVGVQHNLEQCVLP